MRAVSNAQFDDSGWQVYIGYGNRPGYFQKILEKRSLKGPIAQAVLLRGAFKRQLFSYELVLFENC